MYSYSAAMAKDFLVGPLPRARTVLLNPLESLRLARSLLLLLACLEKVLRVMAQALALLPNQWRVSQRRWL